MTWWQWLATGLVVFGAAGLIIGLVAVIVGTWISSPDDHEVDELGRWVHEDRGDL